VVLKRNPGQPGGCNPKLESLQIYTDNNIRVRTVRARVSALKHQVEMSGNKGDPGLTTRRLRVTFLLFANCADWRSMGEPFRRRKFRRPCTSC
jgi:hypothetical protein